MMLQQHEAVLQREIAKASSEKAEIERGLQHLSVNGSTEQDDEMDQSRLGSFK